MPRTTLNDFSETPVENTDIGGVAITGDKKPSNLDDAERATVAILAKAVNGTTPVNDTWKWRDKDAPTKEFRFDAGNLTGSVVIDAKALSDLADDAAGIITGIARRGAPTVTAYTTSGTHTFAEGTAFYRIIAVGAGGGSGAVDGTGAGTGGSTAGGNSGFFGASTIFAKGALTTGTVVIGAGGTAGTSPAPVTAGGDGGDTTWADATVGTLTFKGGKGSPEITATSGHIFGLPLANEASNVSGSYSPGGPGMTNSNSDAGGIGGSTDWGSGGIPTLAFGGVANGVAGSGYGAGASGAASVGVGTNAAGAAGTGGRLEVWEW